MGFFDDLYKQHGQSAQQRASEELGLTQDQAARALPLVAPFILAGLKRQMEQHGAGAVESRMVDLDQNGIPDNGEGLENLLGGQAPQASSLVADKLGISKDVAAKLIPMLAPMIIGMILKNRGGGTADGKGGSGGVLGSIGSILDRNGDGSILDDLGGLVRGKDGTAGKSGCLGSLLGALTGRKK